MKLINLILFIYLTLAGAQVLASDTLGLAPGVNEQSLQEEYEDEYAEYIANYGGGIEVEVEHVLTENCVWLIKIRVVYIASNGQRRVLREFVVPSFRRCEPENLNKDWQ